MPSAHIYKRVYLQISKRKARNIWKYGQLIALGNTIGSKVIIIRYKLKNVQKNPQREKDSGQKLKAPTNCSAWKEKTEAVQRAD